MKKNLAKKSVRLPAHVKPERYRITIKPDFNSFLFYGEETIYLSLEKSSKEITLHSRNIDIHSAEFARRGGKIPARKISYDVEAETATFLFPKNIPAGKGELNLKFEGLINESLRGFYRSHYEIKGEKRHIAVTQFEAVDARQAFPCVDEPAAKAIFDITLMIPGHMTAISNTIEEEISERESGYKAIRFAPTPKMSTYLAAFIVGEFEFIKGKTKEGILVRVFTTPGKKKQARFALKVAKKTISFFNDYFGIPYPLPALDLIAVPDFESGAMENWGAITYRESALLVDPDDSSIQTKRLVAEIIAHELAHQWFGNLVTMEWWTHLWLNEGFASYIAHLAIDNLFPEWDTWTEFVSRRFDEALDLDSLETSHPVEAEVRHPSELEEIFDKISYSKGASVIRMLAGYLGEKDFRNGLRHYLKKHSYGNASTIDLWIALEHVSKKPVEKIMRAWTQKAGYPVIAVREGKDRLELRQSRFFRSELSGRKARDKTVWAVPVSILKEGHKKPICFLMEKKKYFLPKPGGAEPRARFAGASARRAVPRSGTGARARWLKLNSGETGLFRVDYPRRLLRLLRKPVEKKVLSAADRIGIIRDAFALAESGGLPTTEALALAGSYRNENDYNVWTAVASAIHNLHKLLSCAEIHPHTHMGMGVYDDFRRFALGIFSPIARKIGWEKRPGEDDLKALLRGLLLYQAGKYGNKEITGKAKKLFYSRTKSHADVRGTVYALTAENGGRKEFNVFVKMYKESSLQEEKNRIARALTGFKDKKLLRRALEFSLSSRVRGQDAPGLIALAWMNPLGRDLAWDFVKRNWKEIYKRYERGHMLSKLLEAGGCFTSLKDAGDFESFFKKHPAPAAARTITQVLERIRSSAAWLARDKKKIGKWLKGEIKKDDGK